ncbi:MAG TPA: iron ABC transporter permease [Longilinea sp.]|nr:iron ABC transporter permease [Longilinea sp.]
MSLAFVRRARGSALLWLAPLAFLSVFFFYPLAAILRLAGEQALTQGISALDWVILGQSFWFTLWQALLSTALTLLIGLPAAYLFARYDFAGKSLLLALTTVPFILPTVVVAAGFNALLGPHGWINLGLMALFNLSSPPIQFLNTLWAILLAHIFYNTTIVIRVVGNAWSQLDHRIEQAGQVLGAHPLRNFLEVSLPLLRQSILAAGLLVFLFDFTSFGVILLLGGPQFATLEVSIYIQTMQMLNLPLAGLLSIIQLACTLVLTVLSGQLNRVQNAPLLPRLKGEGSRKAETWRGRLFVGSMVFLLVALLILPMAALTTSSFTRLEANRGERGTVQTGLTVEYYADLFVNQRNSIFYVPPFEAALNSLEYAAITTIISIGLGFLTVYALSHPRRVDQAFGTLMMLPLGTSAVTLGLGFVVVFNRPPISVGTFPLLIPIAHSLIALPFVVRTMQPALASIPNTLRQAAAVLGASPRRVWWEVDLPILAQAALVSAMFAFTISLGEFGATSFLANPENPTLPVAIYRFLSLPGASNYGQAMAMATLLMVLCGGSILAFERIGRRE